MALSRWFGRLGRMFNPNAQRDRWEQLRQARHAHRGNQQALEYETADARGVLDYLQRQADLYAATGPAWRNNEFDPGPHSMPDEHHADGGDAGMGAS